VLVVGTGEMGRRAAELVSRRGTLIVASRATTRAESLAAGLAGRAVAFDPGPEIAGGVGAIIVALRGQWMTSAATAEAIEASDAMVVDLSTPPAVTETLAHRLGPRFVSIDELAATDLPLTSLEPRLVARLDALANANRGRLRAHDIAPEEPNVLMKIGQAIASAYADPLHAPESRETPLPFDGPAPSRPG
jgi:hypothetical protein